MKKIFVFILALTFVAGNNPTYGQEKKTKAQLRLDREEKILKMVDARDYIFEAKTAMPMSGRSISLTSGYDLSVSKDTVNAYLPYYGRAYTAPMDNTQGGIQFKSTDFEYREETGKKGERTIFITPKNAQKRYELILRISTSGSATLSVNDDTRQTISFSGNIMERNKK